MILQQLDILFPLFSEETIRKVKEHYANQEYDKLLKIIAEQQEVINHQGRIIAGYRSIEEQRKKLRQNGNRVGQHQEPGKSKRRDTDRRDVPNNHNKKSEQ